MLHSPDTPSTSAEPISIAPFLRQQAVAIDMKQSLLFNSAYSPSVRKRFTEYAEHLFNEATAAINKHSKKTAQAVIDWL